MNQAWRRLRTAPVILPYLLFAAGQSPQDDCAFLARPLLSSPAPSECDDIGDGLKKLHVVIGEAPLRAGVCPEHSERSSIAQDHDAQTAQDIAFSEKLRWSESSFRAKIANHNGPIGLDGVPGVGFAAGAERGPADEASGPAHAGAQQKRCATGKELEDGAELDS